MANRQKKKENLKMWAVIKSVIAGLFGVQSEKNRQRDFNQSHMLPFIVVGIVMIGLLILGLIGLISLITAR